MRNEEEGRGLKKQGLAFGDGRDTYISVHSYIFAGHLFACTVCYIMRIIIYEE